MKCAVVLNALCSTFEIVRNADCEMSNTTNKSAPESPTMSVALDRFYFA